MTMNVVDFLQAEYIALTKGYEIFSKSMIRTRIKMLEEEVEVLSQLRETRDKAIQLNREISEIRGRYYKDLDDYVVKLKHLEQMIERAQGLRDAGILS